MVLFKRKPVQFLAEPDIDDEEQEVWLIPQTGEIFVTYEDYLNRMDFYKQRRFICTISGHSGLTFFEALESELAGAAEVEQAFPEALKGPILRRVQFQTVSRIDTLVDQIFAEFRNDYYPGEAVTVHVLGGERLQGVVRDKTRFGSKVLPDGTLTEPFSRYFVSLDKRPDEEAVVDDSHIFRDRKVFTKSVLRSFIKKTVMREAWNGAPWLVKQDVAAHYHIDTRIPQHLRYDNKLMERKQLQARKRLSSQSSDAGGPSASTLGPGSSSGSGPFSGTGPVRLPELKPAPKSHKSKAQQALQAQQKHQQPQGQSYGGGPARGKISTPEAYSFGMKVPLANLMHDLSPFPVALGQPVPYGYPVENGYYEPEPPPPPPPPKYPIEDLQLEPQGLVRPPLKYMCDDPPVPVEAKSEFGGGIRMKSVGPLLETWDTLNVYCEVFKLDSFTLDDFVEALQIASEERPVQLFDEIHCAVLKILVKSEEEGGKVQIQLPELEEEDEDEEEEQEDSTVPTPEPEPKPTGRATRSSMAKQEAERLAAEAAAAEKEMQDAADAPRHRAEEALRGFDWIEQLRKREFADGGWQLIMVGLLHQLSRNERHEAGCEELLRQLVPNDDADEQPGRATVRQHYARLDINYRVQALQIICMLTVETKAVRGFMEDCSEIMTTYRKEKIEHQRRRKQALEELKVLNDQRKILLPDNMPPSPSLEVKTNGDVKMLDADDLPVEGLDEVPDTDDDSRMGRSLRRGHDRGAERKRKAEKEQEKREKAEAAAKVSKQSKQFLKVLKDIQKKEEEIRKYEHEIAVVDNDLREADCPRTRVLGKDRFWNRYYWFERNGMPYGGLPNSSTAAACYANGCVWVQGPDELEREGYIDMAPEYQNEYQAKFDITVPERKRLEEGTTSVFTAHQWGYYSAPAELDALIDWLDPRGFNEVKLRKEITAYRDRIIKHMESRATYLALPDSKEAQQQKQQQKQQQQQQQEQEQEQDAQPNTRNDKNKKDESGHGVRGSSKRMSTRGRVAAAAATATPEPLPFRCLAWQNTMAIVEFGHIHSEPPPPPPPPASAPSGRSRKQSAKKRETVEVEPEPAPVVATTTTRGAKKGRNSKGA